MNKLFGSDGIRGSVASFPFKDDLHHIAKCFAEWQLNLTPEPCVLFVSDTRKSSHDYKDIIMQTITSLGVDVVDAGILPTAAVSFLIIYFQPKFSGGVVITGSHTAMSENGIKLFNATGTKIDTKTEKEIEDYFVASREITTKRKGKIYSDLSLSKYYVHDHQENLASLKKNHLPRFVIDFAHGATSKIGEQIFSDLNCVLINKDFDGKNTNVNSGSEYYRSFPEKMVASLRSFDADFGISFDGDGDRVVLIDKLGNYYDGDTLLGLLAIDMKQKSNLRNSTVVTTRMCNSGLGRFLTNNGISYVTVRNGDKFVTEKLIEKNLTLGGEQTGHIIINDTLHITGDSIRTTYFILNFIESNGRNSLWETSRKLKKWSYVNISVDLINKTDVKIEEIPRFSGMIEDIRKSISDISILECRPASTEPVYRIIIEAKETGINHLAKYGYSLAREIRTYFKSNQNEIHILDCTNGGFISIAESI